MAAAAPSAASRKTSRGWTTVVFSVPTASTPCAAPDAWCRAARRRTARPAARRTPASGTPPRRAASRSCSRAPGARVSVRRPSSTAASELRRLRPAHAGDRREVVRRRSLQPVQAAARGEQRVGDAERVRVPAAAAEHQRDQLVVAERGGAVPQQLLTRPVVGRQIFHLLYPKGTNVPGDRAGRAATRRSRAVYSAHVAGSSRFLGLLVALSLVPAACGGDPPDKEIQQAQPRDRHRAGRRRRSVCAQRVRRRPGALKRAEDAVTERDYRQALNYALDSRERAQTATKEAADNRGDGPRRRRPRAGRRPGALEAAGAGLKAAEKARVPRATSSPTRGARSPPAKRPCKKRAQPSSRGDYPAVSEGLGKDTAGLRAAARDLEAAAAAGARRRR